MNCGNLFSGTTLITVTNKRVGRSQISKQIQKRSWRWIEIRNLGFTVKFQDVTNPGSALELTQAYRASRCGYRQEILWDSLPNHKRCSFQP